jgi:hypothetical protein
MLKVISKTKFEEKLLIFIIYYAIMLYKIDFFRR